MSVFDGLGKYHVIVADPPWMYQKRPGINGPTAAARGAVDRHYATMTNAEVQALPVEGLAAPDAHLFLWFTNPGMFGGRFSDVTPKDIAESWGFTFKTILTWVKTTSTGAPTGAGMGWFFRGCTEHVLYATRGKAGIAANRREKNVILAPRGRHSAKPDAFLDMVERVIPEGPYLELFARAARPGWTAWGNEAPSAEELGDGLW